MAEKESNEQIKVEDRRLFDREGNVILEEGQKAAPSQESSKAHDQADASPGEETVDLVSILYSYVHTALIYLGDMEDPIQHKRVENLQGARQMIEILELMQQKTKGNLDSREEQFLNSVLFDLRMRFVKKSQVIR